MVDQNFESDAKVEDEDLLLEEIDAFREKAMQLQELINRKQSHVHELEKVVEKKELLTVEIQEKLAKTQKASDEIISTVHTEVSFIADGLNDSVSKMQSELLAQTKEKDEELDAKIASLDETIKSLNTELAVLKTELSEKIHSENVAEYRNLQEVIKNSDFSEKIEEKADERFHTLKGRMTGSMIVSILSLGVSVAILLSMIGLI